ncbi:uncharacterized protein MONOS_17386 [Monocercomonoides exilis]|uniref:uncharacterized protein n=1 Tax=Monocercomonoides exilis TaxID=2049356 RepID=UPI00355A9F95|nr:hypothetical protein MONOS_17386 [Monocercomonoides exilis]
MFAELLSELENCDEERGMQVDSERTILHMLNKNYVIVNELHFAREAARELEELTRYVDWKRNEEEEGEKESGEEKIFKRWLRTLAFFLEHCQLWHEEIVELICGTVKVFRAAKENNRDLCDQCVSLFEAAADGKDMSVDGLLKDGTIDLVLEEIQQSTLDYKMTIDFFLFFMNTSRKLKEEEEDELEEAKRKKVKRKLEKMY